MRKIDEVLDVKAGPGGQTMRDLVEARNVTRAEYNALSRRARKRRTPEQIQYDEAHRMLRSACIRHDVEYPD